VRETELSGVVEVVVDKINDSMHMSLDSRDVQAITTAIENGFGILAEAIKEAAKTVWLESQ
jgi:uncharacterized protein YqgV (UPF0045/DUF77 family)